MDAIESNEVNALELVALTDDAPAAPASLDELTLPVEVVLDRRLLSLAQVEQLHEGGVYRLSGVTPGRPVALCCNGTTFARGELVSVENQWAVLITERGGEQA